MKFLNGFEVNFIENVLPTIQPLTKWSNEKIIYKINFEKVIWYTVIETVSIKNEFLEMDGKYMKALLKFVDGSEKKLYIDLKELKSIKIDYDEATLSKYEKEFKKVIKDI